MKYLYIDDENDTSVEAISSGFNDQGLIEVEVSQPKDFKSQIKDLLESLTKYDGLILDLRLDQNMQLDVSYNAPAIAQELRTKVLAPNAFPIILCSTDERMRSTYDIDQTSHDLFDYKFLKGSEPNWEKFSKKLQSLAEGYKWLNKNTITSVSVLNRFDLTGIDSRIVEKIEDQERNNTTYDFSNFIIKDIFHHPGALIKERLVAARLGIDIEASIDSWIELRDSHLNDFKYTGVFGSGWDRWWSDKLISFFKEISGGKRLSSLNAVERVQYIKEAFNLQGLVAASPIPYCSSTNFWTVCEESKKPLDPLEGFKVFESIDLRSWQEPKYLSFNAIAVEGVPKHKGLRPQVSELKRIQLMKETFSGKNED
jgi:hypothetical protein